MSVPQFFPLFQSLLPRWLTNGDGGKVVATLTLVADDMIARSYEALIARFPSFAPDDQALAALGRDRRILRGINEPAAAYAARLSRAFDDHRTRGNSYALLRQLRAYLQAPCVVRTVDVRGNWYTIDADGNESSSINAANWDWDGSPPAPEWGRFWVIIYPANGIDPFAPAGNIGSPTLWGNGTIGNPGYTIGTTATTDQIAGIRSLISQWKPAGTRCEWVIVAFDPASFSPAGSTNPAGQWGNWSDGFGAPIRLSTARYFKGSQ